MPRWERPSVPIWQVKRDKEMARITRLDDCIIVLVRGSISLSYISASDVIVGVGRSAYYIHISLEVGTRLGSGFIIVWGGIPMRKANCPRVRGRAAPMQGVVRGCLVMSDYRA